MGLRQFKGYTEGLADLISIMQSYHLYADDTSSIATIKPTVDRLQDCVTAIHQWCGSRRLLLNPTKTELIWFGSHANLQKIATTDHSLRVDGNVIHTVRGLRA